MATRTRRPMVDLVGTIADLRVHDYVDTVGGSGYRKFRVGALVDEITELAAGDRIAGPLAEVGFPGQWAESGRLVRFLAKDSFALRSDCPVSFRRFADSEEI